jgi:hypothetical protein
VSDLVIEPMFPGDTGVRLTLLARLEDDEPTGPDSVVQLLMDDVGQLLIRMPDRTVFIKGDRGPVLIGWLVEHGALDARPPLCVYHTPKRHVVMEVLSVQ